jgi:hypothetical protein
MIKFLKIVFSIGGASVASNVFKNDPQSLHFIIIACLIYLIVRGEV